MNSWGLHLLEHQVGSSDPSSQSSSPSQYWSFGMHCPLWQVNKKSGCVEHTETNDDIFACPVYICIITLWKCIAQIWFNNFLFININNLFFQSFPWFFLWKNIFLNRKLLKHFLASRKYKLFYVIARSIFIFLQIKKQNC